MIVRGTVAQIAIGAHKLGSAELAKLAGEADADAAQRAARWPGPEPVRVVPPGVTRVEYRRFLKALRKRQKQARCRGYSP
jgi:hypothetical protein